MLECNIGSGYEDVFFCTYNEAFASSPTTRAIGAEDGALVYLSGSYKAEMREEMSVRPVLCYCFG